MMDKKMSLREAEELNAKGELKDKVLTENGWYLPADPNAVKATPTMFAKVVDHPGSTTLRLKKPAPVPMPVVQDDVQGESGKI